MPKDVHIKYFKYSSISYIPIIMAKPEHQYYQMLTSMWSNRNSHSFLVGMENGTDTGKYFGSFFSFFDGTGVC
jgi:hypothetical protein